MKNEVIPVEIRALIPTTHGSAIFIGNDEKVFVIQVENRMGAVIDMFKRGVPKERPLTHDLINSIFKGLGVTVERVLITKLENATYYALLRLKQQNELGTNVIEIDARPSDSIALAVAHQKPIYVTRALFDQVEDMSAVLEQAQRDAEAAENEDDETEESDEEEEEE